VAPSKAAAAAAAAAAGGGGSLQAAFLQDLRTERELARKLKVKKVSRYSLVLGGGGYSLIVGFRATVGLQDMQFVGDCPRGCAHRGARLPLLCQLKGQKRAEVPCNSGAQGTSVRMPGLAACCKTTSSCCVGG
jgi:hypothetical protein